MPCRSRSFTIADESSNERSVNSGVICGAVTRSIKMAKKPTSATVTAAMAAIRAAPSDLRNSVSPCTGPDPVTSYPAIIARFMVTVRLMKTAAREVRAGKSAGGASKSALLDHFHNLVVFGIDQNDLIVLDEEYVRFHLRDLCCDLLRQW